MEAKVMDYKCPICGKTMTALNGSHEITYSCLDPECPAYTEYLSAAFMDAVSLHESAMEASEPAPAPTSSEEDMAAPDGFVKRLLRMEMQDRDYIMSLSATIADLRYQLARKDEGLREWETIKALYRAEWEARRDSIHPNQYHGHAHDVDGIWDRDNGKLAGCGCAACAMHRAALREPDGRKGE